MKPFALEQGQSDPLSYECTCSAGENRGSVLLFYRYWANDPKLPDEHASKTALPEDLASWHRKITKKLELAGKLRIAKEGFNITVAGTRDAIADYVQKCCNHWSFAGLDLSTEEAQDAYFKPSVGCACVFGNISSVRVAAEITPMGVEGYVPSDWSSVESLSPAEFHERCHEDNVYLLDVRNHYESKIGYFVSPTSGEPATRPQVRRFSQFPQWISQQMTQGMLESVARERKQILTYCTGGIRCEKAVRWMQENTPGTPRTATLNGGIAAYLAWMDGEIKAGRKGSKESLFKGRNYVFDARGSTGLSEDVEPVARCHGCGRLSDRLSKCRSRRCHLVLVVCQECEDADPRCCRSCVEMDGVVSNGAPTICKCEQLREQELWGGERIKSTRKGRLKRVKDKKLNCLEIDES